MRAAAYVGSEGDFIPSVDHMDVAACTEERARLILEKTHAEQELLAAKNTRNERRARALGCQLQTIATRISALNKRIKALNGTALSDALHRAMCELLSDEQIQAVYERRREILNESGVLNKPA